MESSVGRGVGEENKGQEINGGLRKTGNDGGSEMTPLGRGSQ